jgi:ATP phosphoribosyltransferase regulatory subunit HisZ
MLSRLLSVCGSKAGDKVKVRIKGGCSHITGREKSFDLGKIETRSTDSSTISFDASNDTLRDPYGDGSLQYIALPLGNLQNGHYDLKVTFDGAIDSLAVITASGTEYAKYVASLVSECDLN